MYVFLSVIGILTLFLIMPVGLVPEYSKTGFSCYLKILFFKLKLGKKKSGTETQKTEKEKQGGDFKTFKAFAEPIFKTAGKLIRFLCVNKLTLNLTLAAEDAFSTAMLYGSTAAAVGVIFPLLNNNINIRKQYISINADFNSAKSVLYLYSDISIRIWQILVLAVYFIYKYIRKLYKERICKNG